MKLHIIRAFNALLCLAVLGVLGAFYTVINSIYSDMHSLGRSDVVGSCFNETCYLNAVYLFFPVSPLLLELWKEVSSGEWFYMAFFLVIYLVLMIYALFVRKRKGELFAVVALSFVLTFLVFQSKVLFSYFVLNALLYLCSLVLLSISVERKTFTYLPGAIFLWIIPCCYQLAFLGTAYE
jgi:hypothetical protein